MGNIAIKALMGVLMFAVMDALVILILQQIMALFNFTGDFAELLAFIFGSVISVVLGLLALQKIADQF